MITEDQARKQVVCPACGEDKAEGTIVCWGCFKHSANSLKYTDLPWEEWLNSKRAFYGLPKI